MFLSHFKKYIFALLFLTAFFQIQPVNAALGVLDGDVLSDEKKMSEQFQQNSGYSDVTSGSGLKNIVAQLIKIFLGLLGVIFVILIIVAGYKWFMAGGDSKQVDEARDRIIRATVGLTIVISAYAITYFVFNQLDSLQSVGGTSNNASGPTGEQIR